MKMNRIKMTNQILMLSFFFSALAWLKTLRAYPCKRNVDTESWKLTFYCSNPTNKDSLGKKGNPPGVKDHDLYIFTPFTPWCTEWWTGLHLVNRYCDKQTHEDVTQPECVCVFVIEMNSYIAVDTGLLVQLITRKSNQFVCWKKMQYEELGLLWKWKNLIIKRSEVSSS